ncbi:hypothetical protein COB21_01705 [Candidatus Aerophobetes bacterium]|uniref:Uncharacterized protein n=1 Tax=Aerophobetes bacterium TaxID=2030807 RepID=A0A2A4X7K4_UNCAE|nr:MAG: hypothetical protein COB21_01705 [Candidatus Aerophobetes bacterium]
MGTVSNNNNTVDPGDFATGMDEVIGSSSEARVQTLAKSINKESLQQAAPPLAGQVSPHAGPTTPTQAKTTRAFDDGVRKLTLGEKVGLAFAYIGAVLFFGIFVGSVMELHDMLLHDVKEAKAEVTSAAGESESNVPTTKTITVTDANETDVMSSFTSVEGLIDHVGDQLFNGADSVELQLRVQGDNLGDTTTVTVDDSATLDKLGNLGASGNIERQIFGAKVRSHVTYQGEVVRSSKSLPEPVQAFLASKAFNGAHGPMAVAVQIDGTAKEPTRSTQYQVKCDGQTFDGKQQPILTGGKNIEITESDTENGTAYVVKETMTYQAIFGKSIEGHGGDPIGPEFSHTTTIAISEDSLDHGYAITGIEQTISSK